MSKIEWTDETWNPVTGAEQLEISIAKSVACDLGFHDVFLTGCILGYDYQCRVCGLCRYYDVEPPDWALYEGGRNPVNVGYPLNERLEYVGAHRLNQAE